MRKFYLPAFCILFFILVAEISKAQYATTLSGGTRNITDPLTWQVPGPPPFGCTACTVTINGSVIIDDAVRFSASTVTVKAGAVLDVNFFVELINTSVVIENTATVNVNDEVHLYAGVLTNIRLGNNAALIDATNGPGNPSHGTINPGSTSGAGIYFILQAAPPVTGATQFDVVLHTLGYGGHFTRPFNPVVAGFGFKTPYTVSCTDGVDCFDGFILGPSDVELAPAPPPGTVMTWQFIQTAPLPVELAQFAASLKSNHTVDVDWATSEEINSDYFSVERSADGAGWLPIGNVPAKGLSSGIVHYSFNDPAPFPTLSYYRLKIVDRDAKFKYSKTAVVSLDGKSAGFVVYNNPFNDQIRIKVNSAAQDNLSLTLTDMLGRTYARQFFSAQAGDNFINITPTGASTGLYILNIKGKNINQTVKLVKE